MKFELRRRADNFISNKANKKWIEFNFIKNSDCVWTECVVGSKVGKLKNIAILPSSSTGYIFPLELIRVN